MSYSEYCHLPPLVLPRRGGIVTLGIMIIGIMIIGIMIIDSMIIVCIRQIVNVLSIAIVSVPPLRGRLGGG